MKKKIYYIFLISILITGGGIFSFHAMKEQSKKRTIHLCLTTHDEEILFRCSNTSQINYQIKYDMFYKNHIHSNRLDNSFIQSYYDCKNHANECSIHDSSIFYNFIDECSMAGHVDCINISLENKTSKSFIIFQNTVINNIDTIIPEPCSESSHNYFLTLSSEQKQKLDARIVKACSY
jgi:hypothetical protein